jgi:hypothetical protein
MRRHRPWASSEEVTRAQLAREVRWAIWARRQGHSWSYILDALELRTHTRRRRALAEHELERRSRLRAVE